MSFVPMIDMPNPGSSCFCTRLDLEMEMTLSGKETTMRRGACLLALLGMTVQSVAGDEFFGAGTARPLPAAAPATATTSGSVPQKFTRSAAGSKMPNEELRNYYKELFGAVPPQEDSSRRYLSSQAGSSGQTPVTPVSGAGEQAVRSLSPAVTAQPMVGSSKVVSPNPVFPNSDSPTAMPAAASTPSGGTLSFQRSATFPVGESASTGLPAQPSLSNPSSWTGQSSFSGRDDSKVIHAEFRDDAKPGDQKIQQVHEETFSARPFPISKGGQANSSARIIENFSPTKTEPVKTASAGPEAPVATPSRGSVTFSRQNPAAARRGSSIPASKPSVSATSITQAPAVTVEWRKQTDLNVGQECMCHLIVKNSGQTAAKDMEVQAYFPESIRLLNAKPAPSTSDRYLGWNVDELKPGEERTIEITMVPLQRGDINTRAEVRFSGIANGRFAVAEPMLDVSLEGPKEVLLGESAAQTVTVSNPGTGIASHVQIEAIIPEGLEHARGQRLQMDLGNLNPGESRSVRLALAASKGGPQHLMVNARAESGLARSTSSDVQVIAPNLTAEIHGPGLRYLGRQGQFVMSVTNAGEAPSDNVQMRYKMPSGFDFVSADRGAQYDPATGLVTWFVGRLEQGQKSEIKVTLLARQSGEFKHLARASSEHGAMADAEFTTMVEGTPSLAVQVKDLEDPVEVGSEMAYEIRVKNEGSASAKAVTLTCELADGTSLVTAEGPAEYLAERNTIVFRGLPEVGAGQTVVFKVKIKAATGGNLRFRAHLSSESISEPLTAEEMTKFYGE